MEATPDAGESSVPSGLLSTQGAQDAHAADRETDHGCQGCDQHKVGAGVKEIGKDRADREEQA